MPKATTPPKTSAEVIAAYHKYPNAKVEFRNRILKVDDVLMSVGRFGINGYTEDFCAKAEDCTLQLYPLSSITDEHAIEVAKIYYKGYSYSFGEPTYRLIHSSLIYLQRIHSAIIMETYL